MSFATLVERNRVFAAGRQPQALPQAGPIPHLVLACYDPRLDVLLPDALGLDQGHEFLIRSAGAVVTPSGDPLRSIALAVYMFKAMAITVVGHTSCRMAAFDTGGFIEAFRKRGVRRDVFGAEDLRAWAGAIADPRRGVLASVAVLRGAHCLPHDLEIGGVVLDDATGALEVIVRPDEALPGEVAPAQAAAGRTEEGEARDESPAPGSQIEPPRAAAGPRPQAVAAPDVTKLVAAAGSLVQVLEAQAAWRGEVRRLRAQLHAERNPIARVRLIDAFVRKAVAESREVAAAFDRLRREAQGGRVQLDENLLFELVRRALMGEKQ